MLFQLHGQRLKPFFKKIMKIFGFLLTVFELSLGGIPNTS